MSQSITKGQVQNLEETELQELFMTMIQNMGAPWEYWGELVDSAHENGFEVDSVETAYTLLNVSAEIYDAYNVEVNDVYESLIVTGSVSSMGESFKYLCNGEEKTGKEVFLNYMNQKHMKLP